MEVHLERLKKNAELRTTEQSVHPGFTLTALQLFTSRARGSTIGSDKKASEMLSAQTITLRLEAYLMQLSDVQQRWQSWLSKTQSAATKADTQRLLRLQEDADSLGSELEEISRKRQEMLAEARQSGWQARNLQGLAERLPAWNRPKFRSAFSTAKTQLEQLKRLHLATWVMLNRSAQHYQEMTMLLTIGTAYQDVYGMDFSKSRDGGGQLLDTSV